MAKIKTLGCLLVFPLHFKDTVILLESDKHRLPAHSIC